jgi:hypothetical protein
MEAENNIASEAPNATGIGGQPPKSPNAEGKTPQITKAEVLKWENDFRENVSPLVKFDKQDNGFSMKFYNGESGVDSYWSGIIILKSDNYLKWNFSMVNGVFIDAKMNLDENNQKLSSNLYDFFKSWQTEVSKSITEPKEESSTFDNTPTPELVGPESNNIPDPSQGPPVGSLAEGLIITNRIQKTRKESIMDSAERMRRLAGLK